LPTIVYAALEINPPSIPSPAKGILNEVSLEPS